MSATQPVADPFVRATRRRSDLHPGAVVAVALGGAIGGPLRYLAGEAWPIPRTGFPYATLFVNVLGSFTLCALLVMILEVWPPSRYARPLIATGIIGAFTTYGTVMVEVDQRVGDGRVLLAIGYLVSTLVAGLSAAYLGLLVGRVVANRRPREKGATTSPARGGRR